MTSGLWILIVVVVSATAFGVWRRLTDGRIRGVAASGPETPDDAGGDLLSADDLGVALGGRATLVQFSTAFCQPCRAARRTLAEVADMITGVTHVEIDAEAHLDLVRRLDIMRTPTILVLDPAGRVTRRAVGAPRKADLIAALGEVID